MNYSNAFRQGAERFLGGHFYLNPTERYPIKNLDDNRVFTYLISRYGLQPVVGHNESIIQYVLPIYKDLLDSGTVIEINKAESIVVRPTHLLTTYKMGDSFFYASRGFLFDENKNPIILVCKKQDSMGRVICLDYSILKHQDTPMNRFIIRKLLPYIIETDKVFMFANCSSFVVKPTFQGELDGTLVKDFLVSKIRTEYAIRHEKSDD